MFLSVWHLNWRWHWISLLYFHYKRPSTMHGPDEISRMKMNFHENRSKGLFICISTYSEFWSVFMKIHFHPWNFIRSVHCRKALININWIFAPIMGILCNKFQNFDAYVTWLSLYYVEVLKIFFFFKYFSSNNKKDPISTFFFMCESFDSAIF